MKTEKELRDRIKIEEHNLDVLGWRHNYADRHRKAQVIKARINVLLWVLREADLDEAERA